MPDRALYAITHVASQLLYRWLPLPHVDLTSPVASAPGEIEKLGAEDWRRLIAWATSTEVMPWLNRYISQADPGGAKLLAAITAHIAGLSEAGARYLLASDPDYPEALRSLPDPPIGLSLLGDANLLVLPKVAVIGSRMASAFALRESFALGRFLAQSGVTVVSGGAIGCDITAHYGVLDVAQVPPRAVCVFAGGLSTLYPRINDRAFVRLRRGGAVLLSERLWSASCRPVDFTARNRIIAGLAEVTAVMQAAERSGALVTARLALDYGRDVAALVHPPDDVRGKGGTALLADGAAPFTSAANLMEKLGLSVSSGEPARI